MRNGSRPLALVYRGRATLPGCAESVADLLRLTAMDQTLPFA